MLREETATGRFFPSVDLNALQVWKMEPSSYDLGQEFYHPPPSDSCAESQNEGVPCFHPQTRIQTGPLTFVEIQHLHQADTVLIVDDTTQEGYQLAKIHCVFSFDCGDKGMDLSIARDNWFTPGHSVSLDGINWWPADCFDSIHPQTPSNAQALPRHAALEVHVTQVFSLLVVGGGLISLGNNFWVATLGARTQRQPFDCHFVQYLPEDLQLLEELPGCATGRAYWQEGSVTSIRDRPPSFRADSPGPHVLPAEQLATLWWAANDEDNVPLFAPINTEVEVPLSLAVLEAVAPDPSEVALAATINAGYKTVGSARAVVLVGTGVYAAMNPAGFDNANTSALAPTAVADYELWPLSTWAGGVGLVVPAIPEMQVDVNTAMVNSTRADAPGAEDDMTLLGAAADADMNVPVPSAVPTNADSASIECPGALVLTTLAVLGADGDDLVNPLRTGRPVQ